MDAFFYCSLVHKFVIGFHFALFNTILSCSAYIKQVVTSPWKLPCAGKRAGKCLWLQIARKPSMQWRETCTCGETRKDVQLLWRSQSRSLVL